jgi:hypothetical protein
MVAALEPEKTSPHDQKKLSTDIPRIPDDLKFNPLVDSALEATANATIDETSFGQWYHPKHVGDIDHPE